MSASEEAGPAQSKKRWRHRADMVARREAFGKGKTIEAT
jgi:hypothetical protein